MLYVFKQVRTVIFFNGLTEALTNANNLAGSGPAGCERHLEDPDSRFMVFDGVAKAVECSLAKHWRLWLEGV
jgi:hypothetical protein